MIFSKTLYRNYQKIKLTFIISVLGKMYWMLHEWEIILKKIYWMK